MNLWKQQYLLDLDIIDEQHQHFFALCGEIVQLAERPTITDSGIKDIIQSIGAMRTYAFLHFKTEEELMLQFSFPGYLHHTGFHNTYLKKMMEFENSFKALLTKLKSKEPTESEMKQFLLDMSDYIANWWAIHIVKQDTLYAKHVKNRKTAKQ